MLKGENMNRNDQSYAQDHGHQNDDGSARDSIDTVGAGCGCGGH